MKKVKIRNTICCLLVAMLASTVFSGCGGENSDNSNASTGTESSSASAGSTSESDEPQEKQTVTMFFGDAGISFPEDIDKSDNPFLNLIEEKANVDLVMDQPAYSDFQTKFSLMMASGDIPDIVHGWFHTDVDKYGSEGAFVDWSTLIPESELLSSIYTDEMLDTMRTESGAIYGLRVQSSGMPEGTYARIDLIEELNDGVIPITPDEWYQFMKKIKEAYPDSIPLSSRGGFMMMDMFWKAYGVAIDGNGVQLQIKDDSDYIWAFEADNARTAVEFHRKLYEEGLLDQTFVTNTGTELTNAVLNHNMVVWRGGAANPIAQQEEFIKQGNTTAVMGMVNNPIADGVDPEDAYWANNPIGWHAVSISAQSEVQDAALRVIEAFNDPDILEELAWGREGVEYNIVDGERVVDTEKNALTAYRTAYAFAKSYWYQDAIDVKKAMLDSKMEGEQKEMFDAHWDSGVQVYLDEANSIAGIKLSDKIPSVPDVAAKYSEARNVSLSILYNAIMGEISMEEYDQQVADFIAKYSDVKDAYNKSLDDYLANNQ